MNAVELIQSLAGLLVAVGGLVGLVKVAGGLWERAQLRKGVERIADIIDQAEICERLKARLEDCERVVFLAVHNSGDVIKPGVVLKTSVISETISVGKLPSKRESWKNVSPDDQYTRLLQSLYVNGSKVVRTRELPERCILRNMYASEGVVGSVVVRVNQSKRIFHYLSCNFVADEMHEPTDAEMGAIQSAASELRGLL